VITNGYDAEELREVKAESFDHFAIVYAGIFYPPERAITPVLQALKQLERSNETIPWQFHYYGDHADHVRGEARKLDLTDRVKLHGIVSRSKVLSAIKGANLAVVITSVFEQGTLRINVVPGKLFETIGLGPPILLVAPEHSDAESIAKSASLVRSYRGNDIEGIECFIKSLMTGSTPQRANNLGLEWNYLGRALDAYLRNYLPTSVSHDSTVRQDPAHKFMRGVSL
jgi:glycosyltransferase involved in cell wall biosynthesis